MLGRASTEASGQKGERGCEDSEYFDFFASFGNLLVGRS
jgi:hypothetical protein